MLAEGSRWLIGAAVALAGHAALGWYATTRTVERPVVAEVEHVVELFDVPPPPPPPPPPAKAEPAEEQPPAPRAAPRAAPPPPALAGKVVAAEADSAAPAEVDFTMTQGEGAQYVGGVTSGQGTNTVATSIGPTQVGAAPGARTAGATIDRSAPVRLDVDGWTCPWPAEAEAEAIDRERVTIRVTVRADGSVERAELVDDPGRGFGSAALVCARRGGGFIAARDVRGQAIRAESPPIRVTFTR